MNNIKLKSCPFCGGEAYFRTPIHEKGTAFDRCMVECRKCGAAPYSILVYEGKTDAEKNAAIAEEWNRRAESEDDNENGTP